MTEEEMIRVGVTDLRRLIERAQNSDHQLAEAIESDQKWRRREEKLEAEVRILRYGIIRVLGLPEDTEKDSPELVYALTHHPMAIPVLQPAPQRHAWPGNVPIDAPTSIHPVTAEEAVVATTATGRRFQELNRGPEHGAREFHVGATQPDDLCLVWEAGAPEHVWEWINERGEAFWQLVDRPDIVMTWHALLAGTEGVVEAVEIKEDREVAAGE